MNQLSYPPIPNEDNPRVNGLPFGWTEYELAGPDAKDFLARLSTVEPRVGQAQGAFFLTPKGSIELFFFLLGRGNDRWSLFFDPGSKDEWKGRLLAFFDKYHFAEDMKLEAKPGKWTFKFSPSHPEAIELPESLMGQARFLSHPNEETNPDRDGADWLKERLQLMAPWPGYEITSSLNPVDLGLDRLIDRRGCYPGQEVIEKIQAKGRSAKVLVRLNGSGQPIQTELRDGETACGNLTSWLASESHTQALAVIRRSVASEGKELTDTAGVSWTIEAIAGEESSS